MCALTAALVGITDVYVASLTALLLLVLLLLLQRSTSASALAHVVVVVAVSELKVYFTFTRPLRHLYLALTRYFLDSRNVLNFKQYHIGYDIYPVGNDTCHIKIFKVIMYWIYAFYISIEHPNKYNK